MDETGEIADAITACVVETMDTLTEEVVESTSFYISTAGNVWVAMLMFLSLFVLIRLGALFIAYIKTGNLGDFETDSFIFNACEGNPEKILPALVLGTFPGSILLDIVGSFAITLVAGLIWPALTVLLPLMAVAYLIRLPIARKQEFIGRLDGTYDGPEE